MPDEAAPPGDDRWTRFISSPGPLIPLAVIAVNLVLAVVTNRVTLRDYPNSGDEYAYLLAARTFASGRLSVPSPPEPRFFDFVHVINNGRYFGKYPPGYPLLLAPGVLLGMPWMVNIVIGAATILATHELARRLFTVEIANLAALLALANPYLVFNSASYFSHPSCLLAATIFVGAALLSFREPADRRWPLLAGAAAGLSFLIRPYTTICIALPTLAYVAVSAGRAEGWRPAARRLAPGLLPALCFLGLNLAYNASLTGSPLRPPFLLYNDGDLPSWASFAGHIGERIGENLVRRVMDLGRWLPLSPVLLLAYPLIADTRGRRDGLLLCSLAGALVVGHLFYFGNGGNQYGPRYLYEAASSLLVVGASVIAAFGRRGAPLLAAALAMNVIFLGLFTRDEVGRIPKRMQLYNLVEERQLRNAIVFVNHRSGAMPARDLIRNDLDFKGPVLYARDFGDWNPKLLAAFPTRSAWFYDVDPANGAGRLRPLGEVR